MSTFWQAVLYLHLLAMAFFVGGQLVFGIAVVPVLRRPRPLIHLRRPKLHALQAAILLASLGIVWLGLDLADRRLRSRTVVHRGLQKIA